MSLRHAILGVLQTGSAHGYQIVSELERLIADHGFVAPAAPEPDLSRERRPFDLTPKGRREFARWLRAPLTLPRPARDEVVIKLVFLGLHDPDRLVPFLERLRRQYLRRVAGTEARATPAGSGNLDDSGTRPRSASPFRWPTTCVTSRRPPIWAGGRARTCARAS
jgi:DNA-binding PadR family transcriptional regulator